jgi:hypothetical protein
MFLPFFLGFLYFGNFNCRHVGVIADADHHGRESGKVPSDWLKKLSPEVIIIGEAPSKNLDYYSGYNTITQNSAGSITFEAVDSKIHIYVENDDYDVAFLTDLGMDDTYGKYIGSIDN